jgi:hypothetical protein
MLVGVVDRCQFMLVKFRGSSLRMALPAAAGVIFLAAHMEMHRYETRAEAYQLTSINRHGHV